MTTKTRQHRKTKRSRRPHWLFVGALAATTSLSGRFVPGALAQADDVLAARRQEVPFSEPTRVALLDESWRDRYVPSDMPARRFDIPPGPLDAALKAFETVTGLKVRLADDAIRNVESPGVSGLLTADEALELLLAGTAVTFHFLDAGTVALEFGLSETVDVISQAAPSSIHRRRSAI